jgi:hypothetical protein
MQSAALDPHVQRRLQNPYNNPLPAIPNFYAVVATWQPRLGTPLQSPRARASTVHILLVFWVAIARGMEIG